MKNTLCNASMGVRCQYKRNIKPHQACGATVSCIFQEAVTMNEHGKKLMDATEGF